MLIYLTVLDINKYMSILARYIAINFVIITKNIVQNEYKYFRIPLRINTNLFRTHNELVYRN